MGILRTLKVGEFVTAEELKNNIILKAEDKPIPDDIEIVRVSFLYLGYERGAVGIHFGGATGRMYKQIGENPKWGANIKIEAIYEPQKK